MASSSASPRCSQSPLLRRKRDSVVANQQCMQVQWRFLQHQNPVPPSFNGSGASAAPAQSKRLSPAAAAVPSERPSNQLGREREAGSPGPRGSPSKLYQLFASPQAEAEINEERRNQYESRLQQQQRRAQRQCRVLDDILGETQRKAMLSRIMADMEALALQSVSTPQRARRGTPTDASSGDAGGARAQDASSRSNKRSSVIVTLRNSLSLSAAAVSPFSASCSPGASAINLLPQRRMSTLGSVEPGESRADARLHLSEGDDNCEDDEEDDDGGDDDDDNDKADGDRNSAPDRAPHRTAERIAMAELRRLRRRQERRQQRLSARGPSTVPPHAHADAHVFWQKSSRVTLAHDIPRALLVPAQLVSASSTAFNRQQPSPRVPSSSFSAETGSAEAALPVPPAATARGAALPDEQQSFSNLVRRSRWPVSARTDSTRSLVFAAGPKSPRRSDSTSNSCARDARLPAPASPPLSPVVSPRDARKVQAPYGAWYLPRRQWWALRERERQALTERFPAEAARVPDERHCHHGSPTERSHKLSMAASARGGSGTTVDEHVPAHVAAAGSADAVREPRAVAQAPSVRDVRTLVSCWCAYERRWVQAPRAVPLDDRKPPRRSVATVVQALLVDRDFELSLENFHALVVRGVIAESALAPPREILDARVSAWPGTNTRLRSWWRPRQDMALASLADLQLVVPGVWLGSAATLQHADAVARHKIAHIVRCATASESGSQQLSAQPPIAQAPASPLRTALAYTITLSELSRLDFLRCRREGAVAETWHELEAASRFLLGIVRLHDKFAASTLLPLEDAASGGGDSQEAAEMGLLLYCDSGASASVAVCAALLMFRFCLPLRLALLLVRTTRRLASPSAYLQHQLELFEAALQARRRGLQLLLRRTPA
ncbi:hypothetical protein PybrP1_004581 [[Pythium] brassicae (nom. inval.)]|nr:hypothetical protein PybrP1_004581 [[Pythium] brassicae (nom. inval.)]